MYCEPNYEFTELAYSGQAYGDGCELSVDIVARAACATISYDELYEYLEQYAPYFGWAIILAGLMMVFCGRKLIKPSLFIAGFLASIVLMCLIFYSVYA